MNPRFRRAQRGAGALLAPEYPLDLKSRWGWEGAEVLSAMAAWLEARREDYTQAIEDVRALLAWARTIPREPEAGGEPCWENDYWGTVDALMQCAALRRRDPARYLEVGSGYSTLFARRAIRDFGLRTRIISIDPSPRADVDDICDEMIRTPLESASREPFEQLEAGDVVLLDGSHVALMNTDATVFFLEVLPSLAPGVLVGIDDVFLPWDYPSSWTDRLYGEQYLLAAFLLGGAAGWRVRFPAWWVVECSPLAERLTDLWPAVENRFGRHAGSFWMERVSDDAR